MMKAVHPLPVTPTEEVANALARFRRVIVRRRWEFLSLALATFLVIQGVAFFGPATYAAKAALLIQKSRSSAPLDSDPSQPPTVVSGGVTEEEVNSEIAILTSHEVLAETVTAAGLDSATPPWYLRALYAPVRLYDRLYSRYHGIPSATPMERALKALERAISADRLKSSNVLVVTLESGDPKSAQAVLEELLKNYFKHQTEVHGRTHAGSLFSNQADVMERQLREVEDSIQQVKLEAGTVDPAAERDVQLKIDAELREEADTLRRRLAELDGKLHTFDREQSHGTTRASVSGQILDELKTQVQNLELEQVRIDARYKEGFPLREENRRKLEKTRQALVSERAKVFEHNPTLVLLEHERASAAAERNGVAKRMAVLEEQLRTSRERLVDLDQRTIDATRSQRRARALEQRYLTYLSRGEQARIDSALDEGGVTNVTIVQGASASPKPVSPRRMVVLVVSILGGLLVGLLRCAWLELKTVGMAAVLASVAPSEGR